jgi:pyruvate dehydrogenase E1 component alpha subunit/2-oxoisovalerate dehydrogenase E1 component alpha subunit
LPAVRGKEIVQNEWASQAQVQRWHEEASHQVDEAVAQVQREPAPDPFRENWCALASKHLAEGYDEIA